MINLKLSSQRKHNELVIIANIPIARDVQREKEVLLNTHHEQTSLETRQRLSTTQNMAS